jgi:hypothetical protein
MTEVLLKDTSFTAWSRPDGFKLDKVLRPSARQHGCTRSVSAGFSSDLSVHGMHWSLIRILIGKTEGLAYKAASGTVPKMATD